jgi:hypothetical protein
MEAIRSSETSVQFTRSTRRHIPEDGILRKTIFSESKPINRAKAAAIASYKVIEMLAKKKTPFEDGNVMKGCSFMAGDLFFNEFKNEIAICSAAEEVHWKSRMYA